LDDLFEVKNSLDSLQEEALAPMIWFVGIVGYVTAVWRGHLQTTGVGTPLLGWIGLLLIFMGVGVSWLLRERSFRQSAQILIGMVLPAIVCAVLSIPLNGAIYLFILPVILAMALLTRRGFGIVSILTCLFVLVTGWLRMVLQMGDVTQVEETLNALGLTPPARYFPLLSVEVIFPLLIVLLVVAASWLSRRNLHTAVDWAMTGYQRARQKEHLAQEQEVQLRKVVKGLDESQRHLERMNQLLSITSSQAEEARRLKQQFAQNISHELRTPLNLIVSFSELMISSSEQYGSRLPPAYQRDLNIVFRNAKHLQTLVNDVLDLARIEAMQMTILPEETDPLQLVQEVANTGRGLVEQNGLVLGLVMDDNLPKLMIDPTRIRQVLFNLLNNAVRFTDQGGITLGVKKQEQEIVFSVTDTGMGIAEEDLPRLFEEFQQLDGSTRRRHGGAGLGLSISKRFVELHGGRIWVESVQGQGSTFSFSLPVFHSSLGSSSLYQANEVQSPPGVTREERILIMVTNNLPAAALLARSLHGIHTEVVPIIKDAERIARRILPQAVLVDVSTVSLSMDQFEAIATQWALSDVPLIACHLPTAAGWRHQLGVDGYMIKPFSQKGLWDLLQPMGDKVERVLIIDDDQDFVRLVTRFLDRPVQKIQVSAAYTAAEGLAMIRRRPPNVILMDLGLPDMDGSQLIQLIRANMNWRAISIIVMSGRDETDQLSATLGGVYFSKVGGLSPGDVVQLIEKGINL
jgi:signal transduction histidine kinase/CheY-like chemotaxis protein